jgi:drug/metabolite transporter (DMT)-like permease
MLVVVLVLGSQFCRRQGSLFRSTSAGVYRHAVFCDVAHSSSSSLSGVVSLHTLPASSIWRVIWLGFVGNTLYQALFALGLSHDHGGQQFDAALTTSGFMALVRGNTWIEHITRRMMIGILLAMLGIIFVMTSRGASFSMQTLWGDLITLLSVFCWVVYVLGVRTRGRAGLVHPAHRTLNDRWISGTDSLVCLSSSKSIWAASTLRLVRASLLGAAFMVVAYLLYNRSVRKIGSVQTSICTGVHSVITALVHGVSFGERPTLTQALERLLIIAGVVATRRDIRPSNITVEERPRLLDTLSELESDQRNVIPLRETFCVNASTSSRILV